MREGEKEKKREGGTERRETKHNHKQHNHPMQIKMQPGKEEALMQSLCELHN